MTTPQNASLDELSAQYDADGYCIVHNLLSADECHRLKSEALRVLAEHAKPGASYYVGVAAVSPQYAALAVDQRLVAVLRRIMPDGVMFMSDKFVFKSADKRFATPWHIDAAYWPDTRAKLSVWIPLDDSSEANGTLKVVRGTHRRSWRHDHTPGPEGDGGFGRIIRDQDWPAADEVTCTVSRGSAVFFSDHLVHGSHANALGQDRYTIISTYHAPVAAEEDFDKQFPARRIIVPAPAPARARV